MLLAIRAALGGIQASLRGMETVAENVANMNTSGYRAQRYDAATDSTTPRHDRAHAGADPSEPSPSDVDLAAELVDLKRYELGVRANAKVVQVSDRTLGRILDILDDG